MSARVPRILPVKLAPEPKKEEQEPIIVDVVAAPHPIAIPEPVVEPSPTKLAPIEPLPTKLAPIEPAPMELPSPEVPPMELPPHVQVKVIPTPKKRAPRTVVLAEEPTAPPVTKPLKVIRKRKEEAPKVFETAPKPVPQAMLEGIKTSEENGDQID